MTHLVPLIPGAPVNTPRKEFLTFSCFQRFENELPLITGQIFFFFFKSVAQDSHQLAVTLLGLISLMSLVSSLLIVGSSDLEL